jgi:hypothetical protein
VKVLDFDVARLLRPEGVSIGHAPAPFLGRWPPAAGLEKGVAQGVAASLLDAYEARFGAPPPELAAKVRATHDEATLRAWLKLVVTRSPGEIAAALEIRPPG